MENVNISYNALEKYRLSTKKNINNSEILNRLKILKAWNLGYITSETKDVKIKQYGNLRIILRKQDNKITRIWNNVGSTRFITNDKKEFKRLSIDLSDELGIAWVKNNGYAIDGFEVNSRCYKNYCNEIGFIAYDKLLDYAMHIVKNGEMIRSFNDKELYALDDYELTLTKDWVVTNIRKVRGNTYAN